MAGSLKKNQVNNVPKAPVEQVLFLPGSFVLNSLRTKIGIYPANTSGNTPTWEEEHLHTSWKKVQKIVFPLLPGGSAKTRTSGEASL